jgi:hypothetical protein
MPNDSAATPIFSFTVRGYATESQANEAGAASNFFLEVVSADGAPILHESGDAMEGSLIGVALPKDKPSAETIAAIAERFMKIAPELMLIEGLELLEHIAGAEKSQYSSDDHDEAIFFHLEETEAYLKKQFGLPTKEKRTKNGKLTKRELRDLLNQIRASLPEDEYTFPKVAKLLKQREPERAPSSGEALRVICNRFGLKLKWLRKRSGKRKKRKEANKN